MEPKRFLKRLLWSTQPGARKTRPCAENELCWCANRCVLPPCPYPQKLRPKWSPNLNNRRANFGTNPTPPNCARATQSPTQRKRQAPCPQRPAGEGTLQPVNSDQKAVRGYD